MGDESRSGDDGRNVCFACGRRHDNARLISLPTGTVGLQSREYALYCEAQTVLRWPIKKRREHLENVEKARGMPARRELENEIRKCHASAKGKAWAAVHPVTDR
jgi:hypothetical protein